MSDDPRPVPREKLEIRLTAMPNDDRPLAHYAGYQNFFVHVRIGHIGPWKNTGSITLHTSAFRYILKGDVNVTLPLVELHQVLDDEAKRSR